MNWRMDVWMGGLEDVLLDELLGCVGGNGLNG